MLPPVAAAGRRRPPLSTAVRLVFWAVLVAAAGCERGDDRAGGEAQTPVSPVAAAAGVGGPELVVLTRNAPTTYYIGRDGPAGPEFELVTDFARHLGIGVRWVIVDALDELFGLLRKGEADLAAAGLSRTPERAQAFLPGPSYQQVREQVVCRRGGKRPGSLDEFDGVELGVADGSSYSERLQRLRRQYPRLNWREFRDVGTEALLEKVWKRELDCTIADSNIVAINRRYFPELVVTFDLGEPVDLVWYMPREHERLQKAVAEWMQGLRASGRLDEIMERYYGYVPLFDYVDTRKFIRRLEERLPRYRALFEAAGKKYGIPWTLLAAQSYQESHWNPRARSPTGVRGIMMLTRHTAREMGVENRLDPALSIEAGARYLAGLRRRLPETVSEPDRTWIALAAYNVGMGHIYDARALARRLDHDPDTWQGLKQVLPLLAQKRYYKDLKYGYARGREPVRYVDRIRHYEDLLRQRLALRAAAAGREPESAALVEAD